MTYFINDEKLNRSFRKLAIKILNNNNNSNNFNKNNNHGVGSFTDRRNFNNI